jgi:hypothetical protein
VNHTKKLVIITATLLCLGFPQVASACEDKFGYSAYGYLNKEDWDELKRSSRGNNTGLNDNKLTMYEVQGILGFSGEQIYVSNNGKTETRIWVDRENCRRQVKASFADGTLATIQGSGF